MKKLIILLVLACFVLPVAAYVCQDDTDDDNMPCEVITPVVNCSINASVINLNSSEQFNYSMNSVGDGTCNFSVNFTVIGESYSIVVEDNSSSTINVVADEDPDINFWWLYFIVFFLLLISGIIYHEKVIIGNILLFAAGCQVLLAGIWVFQDGISIYGISVFWIYPFAWILVGLGIILTIYASYDMIHKEEGF